ncbi:peptide ABC transporter ATP-binding protein [Bradyrhizobium sp. NAS80.1]|uniref:ABC transporter ATP-binding protein n=1 Tax=Bradyrhizobium sp. NAS80.1 TaxID=1680159 RepID=UPI00095AE92F|nr:ABC transporter ATP-binding protein [Bradyrhizobium sp. NAS80.1]OKO87686.1 peptide ABC transporter ATP-binding protein [Bradyrhizobium sp. NAS80.1]
MQPSDNILSIEKLTVQFRSGGRWITAVQDVNLDLADRECLGIVGESGSGKSVTALTVLGLHPPKSTRIASGRIRYQGRDLLTLPPRALGRIRGAEIAMIFQDPMSSLNPVLTIGDQIGETLRIHQGLGADDAQKKAVELLDMVRIPDARRRVAEYPHRLSGGMRQRVMIAMAIACRPKILIADEPTTALDVTVQAQILNLLRELRRELGMSVILISHDMGVISEFTDKIAVMYAGQVVEDAVGAGLFEQPMHPYTDGLLRAIPDIDSDTARLATIPGSIPDPGRPPEGCRFHPRCPEAVPTCRQTAPAMIRLSEQRQTRCPPRAARRSA